MFPMFTLVRMAVRGAVLAALIATIVSVAGAVSTEGELETIEEVAVEAYEWLVDLVARVTDSDTTIGDVRLGDLASPQGWADLGSGLFGTQERLDEVVPTPTIPAEVDVPDVLDALDVARMVDEVTPGTGD